MFDRLFNPLYTDSDRVHFGTLDVYINYLSNYTKQSIARYGSLGANSSGIATLSQLIGDANLDILIQDFPDPVDRYVSGIIPTANRIEPIFDPAYKGPIKQNSFVQVRGGAPCVEYVFPVSSSFTLKQSASESWDDWKDYHPLNLVSTDSKELTLFSYLDRIIYTLDPPTYVMFTLDTKGLLLKRIAYLKSEVDTPEPMTLFQWLHQYVISPCLFNDGVTQWLLQQYLSLVDSPKMADDKPIDRWTGASNAEIGQLHTTAMNALGQIIEQNNTDAVRIPKVLASMILPIHGSLPKYRKYLHDNAIIVPQVQYRWGEFLRDYLPNLIALKLAIRDRKSLLSRTLGTQLPREMRLYLQTVPWNHVKLPRARDQIQGMVMNMYHETLHLEREVRYE